MSVSFADIKAARRPRSGVVYNPQRKFTLPVLLLRESLGGSSAKKITAFTTRASYSEGRPKSATSYSEEVTGAKKNLKRAWNPLTMYSLSSRSSHLLSETNPSSTWDADGTLDNIDPAMDTISAMKRLEFGRVSGRYS